MYQRFIACCSYFKNHCEAKPAALCATNKSLWHQLNLKIYDRWIRWQFRTTGNQFVCTVFCSMQAPRCLRVRACDWRLTRKCWEREDARRQVLCWFGCWCWFCCMQSLTCLRCIMTNWCARGSVNPFIINSDFIWQAAIAEDSRPPK